ncbi:SDR family oxidoreductase [Sphingomonas alba]|uniref:SDR family oxidoreductase n=1 Tax=Sphingomonas alba TaxID=2908208 RepID=A0ABT0RN55_9SPHN|nr:SDR family oxidoreductase [Sphingomonas alba]MCL6684084.1 SDR family oxidoreductase [Sphingomonas alba]
MKIKLSTALVMGSSRGIGRAIATKLAREGVKRIGIHYHSRRDEAEKTLALVTQAGSSGVLLQADTSDAKQARSVVEQAAEELGGCDIFVQSAVPTFEKIYEHALSTEVPLSKWQLAFDSQARAFFIAAPTAAKYMRDGGRIIALSYRAGAETGGWQPWIGMGSAKAALESMCRYLAVAMARDGITVNAVSPGAWGDKSTLFGQTPQQVQDAMNEWGRVGWNPMKRNCLPSDVANLCALLCSDEAAFVTGQSIVVDGGGSLMNPEFPLALQVPR